MHAVFRHCRVQTWRTQRRLRRKSGKGSMRRMRCGACARTGAGLVQVSYTEKAPNTWHRQGIKKKGNTYNQHMSSGRRTRWKLTPSPEGRRSDSVCPPVFFEHSCT